MLVLANPAPAPAESALTEVDYRRVNESLVEHHVLPRYRVLAETASALDEVAAGYCRSPQTAQLEPVRRAFGRTLDAWMGVQHLRFGPVELFMRSYRLYFWPQGRGKIAQAVAGLVAEGDPAALEEERFRNASTAVQGLPAAEMLIYGPHLRKPESRAYACRLLTRITAGLAEMSQGILADWRGGDVAFAGVLAMPGDDNPYFSTPAEATLAFFQSLHDGLQLIADIKLKPVLGATVAEARPHLAESGPSGRALRNIVTNLEALQGLYEGESGEGLSALAAPHSADPGLDPLLLKAFRLTIENARGIDLPLADAVADPAARPIVEKLLTQVLALKQLVRTRLAAALGLSVGFNAMDGD